MLINKLNQYGADALTDCELLSLLLTHSSTETSKELLSEYSNLSTIVNLSRNALQPFLSESEIHTVQVINTISKRLTTDSLSLPPKLGSNDILKQYFSQQLASLHEEAICCVYLDAQLRLIKSEQFKSDNVNKVSFPLRKIIKQALNTQTHAIAIAHNHPGGTALPSNSDIDSTHHLNMILQSIEVTLLDHIIVAKNTCFSFKQERLM